MIIFTRYSTSSLHKIGKMHLNPPESCLRKYLQFESSFFRELNHNFKDEQRAAILFHFFIYCLSFPSSVSPSQIQPSILQSSLCSPHSIHSPHSFHPDASVFGSLYTDPTLSAWPQGKMTHLSRVRRVQKHSSVLNQLINGLLKKWFELFLLMCVYV